MKELMKGPNERGREDFENAISDDLVGANHGGTSWASGPLNAPLSDRVVQPRSQGFSVRTRRYTLGTRLRVVVST